MKNLTIILAVLTMSLSLSASNRVCLLIDEQNTAHPKYPNLARVVGSHTEFFSVFHGQKSCFELNHAYYMQHFLWKTPNSIAYGTICSYIPSPEHDGKILQFKGESGSYDCPVVERF
jgi:hypothetical protein